MNLTCDWLLRAADGGLGRIRRSLLALLGLVGLSCCCGCPDAGSDTRGQTTTRPYVGVELLLVVPSGLELQQKWAPAVNDWADAQGGVVEVVELPFDGGAAAWIDELKSAETSLTIVPTEFLGDLVGAGLASQIPQDGATGSLESLGWQQIPVPLRSALDMLGDDPAFVTATCPLPILVVRRDLLNAAGRALPRTWADYDRLVEEIDDWAANRVAVEPRAEAYLATLFFGRAISGAKHPAQHSVELDVGSGEPLIATGPFRRALQEMQSLVPYLASDVATMSPADCLQALTNGNAAIGIVWEEAGAPATAMAQASESASAASEARQLVFLPLPGRTEVYDRETDEWRAPEGDALNCPALCGFSGLSVGVTNVATEQAQSAAWDLWGLLLAYQAEGTLPPLPGPSCIASVVSSAPTLRGGTPAELADYESTLVDIARTSVMVCELPMLGRERFRSELTNSLMSALHGDTPAQTALDDARASWSLLISELGRVRVLNSYRLRLGLVPVSN